MKRNILALVLMLTSLSSCNDFLELVPEHQISNNVFYKTQNDFERALIGAYSSFRGLYSGSAILYAAELRTDNAEINWSSPTVDEMQFEQNALTSTNNMVRGIWNTCFVTISRCNTILNRIEAVDFDAAAKNKIIGETRFLRAFSYFYLVQLFGDVPITEQEYGNPGEIQAADLSRKPVDQVYELILSDLTTAEGLMPATLNNDKTHASIGTVKALLGKVHLTRKNYAAAEAKLKEVMDLNQYGLHENYAALFSEGNNNLKESLFEIQFIRGRSLGNNYSAIFTPAITSMAIFPNNLQGSGRITPTASLFNAYEVGDKRKATSVNDSVRLINGSKSPARYALKFVDFKVVETSDGAVTFTVMRYADVLLMYAEALNEQSKTVQALPFLNMIRTRVALPNLTALDQAQFRTALEKERRVEFMFEGLRWFDLVRTGRARDVLNAYYTSKNQNFSVAGHELLFPIPLAEIELNSKLKQNEGY
ncbi:RagB/SusD family nutrient uptake outer membrane protein [Dyadobacter sp. Leaf189]|uniref:RagB/SusD family nutrient uptake outer membrane protein n=1 Tax=Dyadobacter sp. Leaf189 TaxID=1736295 RepID=UPI0006FCAF10|nr:RagB/SusD family nutrient uptake outer membrane protein [Dyadobacter sp. Leaf189]KQS33856.1 glycan metabolism protein [Dyadobacter sp. Leaf189]